MRLMVLLYSVCGQGHAAVVAGLLRGVLRAAPDTAAVVVSGGLAPPPGCLPDEADLVQLPGYVPSEGLFSGLVPRSRNLPADVVKKTRQRILQALVRTLQPEVLHCEHYPFGRHAFAKEIDRALHEARGQGARLASGLAVLGGRAPEHLREDLVLDRAGRFDRILVHTDPQVERLEDDYPSSAAAPALQERVRYTGYVLSQDRAPRPRSQVRALLGIPADEPLLLAHAGGGRDGADLLLRVLQAQPFLRPTPRLLVVGGPALPAEDAAALEARAQRTPGARFERTRADLFDCVAAADGVVCMAGYASAAELLAARVPALLCPRRGEEQERRARRLAALGRAAVLPREADLPALVTALGALLRAPRPTAVGVDPALDGAGRGAAEILALGRMGAGARIAPAAGGSGDSRDSLAEEAP